MKGRYESPDCTQKSTNTKWAFIAHFKPQILKALGAATYDRQQVEGKQPSSPQRVVQLRRGEVVEHWRRSGSRGRYGQFPWQWKPDTRAPTAPTLPAPELLVLKSSLPRQLFKALPTKRRWRGKPAILWGRGCPFPLLPSDLFSCVFVGGESKKQNENHESTEESSQGEILGLSLEDPEVDRMVFRKKRSEQETERYKSQFSESCSLEGACYQAWDKTERILWTLCTESMVGHLCLQRLETKLQESSWVLPPW